MCEWSLSTLLGLARGKPRDSGLGSVRTCEGLLGDLGGEGMDQAVGHTLTHIHTHRMSGEKIFRRKY